MALSFDNRCIDSVAQLICLGVDPATIRETLLAREFMITEYDAYLCYKAAQLLLKLGFYEDQPLYQS
jgi:hypothetical protein